MTGAVPNTSWLAGCIALDEKGFIKTGPGSRRRRSRGGGVAAGAPAAPLRDEPPRNLRRGRRAREQRQACRRGGGRGIGLRPARPQGARRVVKGGGGGGPTVGRAGARRRPKSTRPEGESGLPRPPRGAPAAPPPRSPGRQAHGDEGRNRLREEYADPPANVVAGGPFLRIRRGTRDDRDPALKGPPTGPSVVNAAFVTFRGTVVRLEKGAALTILDGRTGKERRVLLAKDAVVPQGIKQGDSSAVRVPLEEGSGARAADRVELQKTPAASGKEVEVRAGAAAGDPLTGQRPPSRHSFDIRYRPRPTSGSPRRRAAGCPASTARSHKRPRPPDPDRGPCGGVAPLPTTPVPSTTSGNRRGARRRDHPRRRPFPPLRSPPFSRPPPPPPPAAPRPGGPAAPRPRSRDGRASSRRRDERLHKPQAPS